MFGQFLCRFLHISNIHLTIAVPKSSLALLRKRTGYSFANCKRALQLYENDIDKAEEWLHSEAQKEGWAKVEKLKERATRQGLVAAYKRSNAAAMVEVNCETDFVARSSLFKAFVAEVASACQKHAENEVVSGPISKWCLTSSELGFLPYQGGKTVADLVAMSVGKIGENINLRRALCMKVKDGLNFVTYAHPASGEYEANAIHSGNFAAMVIYQEKSNVAGGVSRTEFGRQLCQHIIGMNPKTIGSMDDLTDESESDEEQINDKTSENNLEKKDEAETSESSSTDDASASDEEETVETRLTHQKFVTDPETTVGHILREASIEVIDFARYERGENVTEATEMEFDKSVSSQI